jgi:hypothetical protein
MASAMGGFDFFKVMISASKEIWMQQEKQTQFLCQVLAFGHADGRLELRSLQLSTQRSAIYLELSAAHGEFSL